MSSGACEKIAQWVCERRSIPYRFRKSVVKRIYPKLLQDHEFEVDFFGMKYAGNSGDYISRMVYFCGAHEKYMLFFLRDWIEATKNDGAVFLDIGANVGNHALFMSKCVSEVHAFEPYKLVRDQLDKKIKLNSIGNIFVYPVGLSNKEEEIPFFAPPGSNLGAGSFSEGHYEGNSFVAKLKVVIGDDLLSKAGVERVDIVKMDIEGHEKFALEGLKKTFEKTRPLIVLEVSPTTLKSFSGIDDFSAHLPKDYKFYRFSVANRDSGRYEIAPYEYGRYYKNWDVIACPNEKIETLNRLASS